jgi:hypothetical protein
VCDAVYEKAFEKEVRENHAYFKSQSLPKEIKIHLILIPLNTKTELIKHLDAKLKHWQAI